MTRVFIKQRRGRVRGGNHKPRGKSRRRLLRWSTAACSGRPTGITPTIDASAHCGEAGVKGAGPGLKSYFQRHLQDTWGSAASCVGAESSRNHAEIGG